MPEMMDEMYCSEQICIPPTFPYLLRQFAKSAIRSQPNDLLKWSTAYFRCLSLNVPPPVKIRLEYPIPRSHVGITPGWLKALLAQMPKTPTVEFKILWDRWIGACLEHTTLIQILCLGAFTEPLKIPLLRFLGLCAAHLTDNLTASMILICEILTEEPEGGSASITCDIFMDLYQFLAAIDGSHDQILKNIYFTDDLLALWKEKKIKFEKAIEKELAAEESTPSEESIAEEQEVEILKVEVDEVISCPSIQEAKELTEDYLNVAEEEHKIAFDFEEKVESNKSESLSHLSGIAEMKEVPLPNEEENEEKASKAGSDEQPVGEEERTKVENEEVVPKEKNFEEISLHEETEDKKSSKQEAQEEVMAIKSYQSVDTIDEEQKKFDEERALKEDLERLKMLQQELQGETDDEMEKFKCQLMTDMPMSSDQKLAINHFAPDSLSELKSSSSQKSADSSQEILEGEDGADQTKYEDVFVPAVPGIGAVVPLNMVANVEEFMKKMACYQHGMVMPRNVKHFNCPPLELLDTEGF